jgi:hypothetical protein
VNKITNKTKKILFAFLNVLVGSKTHKQLQLEQPQAGHFNNIYYFLHKNRIKFAFKLIFIYFCIIKNNLFTS